MSVLRHVKYYTNQTSCLGRRGNQKWLPRTTNGFDCVDRNTDDHCCTCRQPKNTRENEISPTVVILAWRLQALSRSLEIKLENDPGHRVSHSPDHRADDEICPGQYKSSPQSLTTHCSPTAMQSPDIGTNKRLDAPESDGTPNYPPGSPAKAPRIVNHFKPAARSKPSESDEQDHAPIDPTASARSVIIELARPVSDADQLPTVLTLMATLFPEAEVELEDIFYWPNDSSRIVMNLSDVKAATTAENLITKRVEQWNTTNGNPILGLPKFHQGAIEIQGGRQYACPLLTLSVPDGTTVDDLLAALQHISASKVIDISRLRVKPGNQKLGTTFASYLTIGANSMEEYNTLNGVRLRFRLDPKVPNLWLSSQITHRAAS